MAYKSYLVNLPDAPGKLITLRKHDVTYVYFEYDRVYYPDKQYTKPLRKTIGKLSPDDPTKMYPNDTFLQFFPDVEIPEEEHRVSRSAALRIGTYLIIDKIIRDYKLKDMLYECMDERDTGLFLDLAAYTIITENNAGQYYPIYTFDHPLFTYGMRQYSDSTVSDFLASLTASQSIQFLELWNEPRDHREKIYISYDSTNKKCQAGDVEMVEIGHSKEGDETTIFNYAMAFDTNNREPLFYEKYSGSIVDVSQLQYMIEKVAGYGYKHVGLILDRGYFSEPNIRYMDKKGISFVMMVKGNKSLVNKLIMENMGTFESKRSCNIYEYGVYGITVKSKLYKTDKEERYFHIYHSVKKESRDRTDIEKKIHEIHVYLENHRNKHVTPSKRLLDYFGLEFYDKRTGEAIIEIDESNLEYAYLLTATEKESVVENELNLAGYFCIITSDKMTAKDAIELYKSRDISEKLFRGDKSYLGNKAMRGHTTETVDSKIFIEFIALIIRNKIYTYLKDEMKRIGKSPNYMTVPGAIKELEKIEMVRHADGTYGLYSGATATQKNILKAFGIDANYLKHMATKLSIVLKETEGGK